MRHARRPSPTSRRAALDRLPPCHPSRYRLHPGAFDSCIHLAPVPAAGAAIAVTRVPVAADALLLPSLDGKAPAGWAAAASVHISAADKSAVNDLSWLDGIASGRYMRLGGLLAKAVPPAADVQTVTMAAEAAGAELLYAVEWQAHSATAVLAATAAAAAEATWLFGSETVRVHARAWHSGASFAAANLEAVQRVSSAPLPPEAPQQLPGLSLTWLPSCTAGRCRTGAAVDGAFAHAHDHLPAPVMWWGRPGGRAVAAGAVGPAQGGGAGRA